MTDLLPLFLAVLFFVAAFGFWVLAWTIRTRPQSLTAFWVATVFELAAFATLAVWRLIAN